MKDRVIVDLGVIPYDMVKQAVLASKYEVMFIGSTSQVQPLRDLSLPNSILDYSDFTTVPSSHELSVDYNQIFNAIIDDYNTLMIAERVSYRRGYRSNHNDIAKIDIMIENYISFFKEYNPKFVFFQACPHNINTWVFASVAEQLNIKIYMCNNACFHWRNFLLEGLHEEKIVELGRSDKIDNYSKNYIDKALKSYENAIPEYERKRLAKRKNKFWSWKVEILSTIKNIRMLYSLPLKYTLFKSYQAYCKVPDLSQKFVVVFLHYQPERTSMPEGLYYANQWHLINTIHRALPADYHLYVKEHPSTFTNTELLFDPRYRNPELYKNISELNNTTLVDLSVDSFSLIDNAVAVATITGTVGNEALLRGKPVLVFGNATYRDNKYAYIIKNWQDVKQALSDIENIKQGEVQNYTINEYLCFVARNSMLGIEEDEKVENLYSTKYRNVSIAKLLNWLLLK